MTRGEASNQINDIKTELVVHLLKKDIEALDMAISVLSAEGEYIKKADILNELGDVNMDILTDEVKEIVNDLPSYSFPDSAEDNTMEWLENEDGSYECSKCHMTRSGLISGNFNFCPNCGRKAVQK